MHPAILAILMIAAFACAIGGVAMLRRGERHKSVLMLIMAAVLVVNVAIWAL
jgi:hypothetical protein